MESLIQVLRQLDALGFPRILRHVRDAKERELESGRSLHAWLFQKAPKEMMQFIAGRMTKAPFVEDLHEARENANRALFQAVYCGQRATGPGVAYLFDAPAVALRGVASWEVDPLALVISELDQEGETIVERIAEVVHLCRTEQVFPREESLRRRVLQAVASGNDLWTRRTELFRRLDFCDDVESQIRSLSGNEFYFQQVVLALSRLDLALATWSSGAFHPGMDNSPESKQTLDHRVYGVMRDFSCPDGQTRRFSNHLKLFSNNWRIYYWEFRIVDDESRAFVGYVGKHLPTVRHPT